MANLIKKSDFFTPSVFKDFFEDEFFPERFLRRRIAPPVNVSEDNEKYLVEISAPGISKENIKVKLDGNTLTVSYDQETSDEVKEKNYHRKEFQKQSFSRSFTLPENVKSDEIKSKHEDGVLSITLPKKEVEEKPESIDIEVE